ncbi:WXG100 family type VII secretion target [Mycetocola spongiae]|uniref:WXG100 family type VII secretion target n=1 Tax=Mycetocola spongiae TaxID=2859226 RepID=UPI001CF120FE|nr:WXG100 family type VII secretion target [Mycetocola spongiae]UCR88935.1 WXG100 family type VII secretion target [Mycetocola spongiae]
MRGYRVEATQLEGLLTTLSGFEEFQHEILGRVRATAEGLGADWSGPAQAAFLDLYERWQVGAREMTEASARMSAAAAIGIDNYAAVAAANRGVWS